MLVLHCACQCCLHCAVSGFSAVLVPIFENLWLLIRLVPNCAITENCTRRLLISFRLKIYIRYILVYIKNKVRNIPFVNITTFTNSLLKSPLRTRTPRAYCLFQRWILHRRRHDDWLSSSQEKVRDQTDLAKHTYHPNYPPRRNEPPSSHRRPEHTLPPQYPHRPRPLQPKKCTRPFTRLQCLPPDPHCLPQPPYLPQIKPRQNARRLRSRNRAYCLARQARCSRVRWVDAHSGRGVLGCAQGGKGVGG